MDGIKAKSSSPKFKEDTQFSPKNKKVDYLKYQTLVIQNEHLQEKINQLNQSLKSKNKQLKQAIQASKAVESFADQIKSLKQQLSEMTRQRDDALQKIQTLKLNSKTPKENSDSSLIPVMDLQVEKDYISQIRKLRNNLEVEKSENQKLQNEADHYKRCLNKSQKKIETLSNEISQTNKKNTLLNETNKKLQSDLETVQQDLDETTEQLSNLQNQRIKFEDTISQYRNESYKKSESLNHIQSQFENQLKEICKLNQERQKMSELMYNLHSCLCLSEAKLGELHKQNELLAKKIKSQKVDNFEESRINLSSLEIPLDGEIKTQLYKIISMDQFSPLQRIQMIINELSNTIFELRKTDTIKTEKVSDITADLNNEKRKIETLKEIHFSLIKQLLHVVSDEESLGKIAFYDYDENFVNLIISETNKQEILALNSEEAKYIPKEFFITGDVNYKKQILMNNIQINDEALLLFTSQFLINELQNRQLQKAKNSLSKQLQIENISKELNCPIENIQSAFNSLEQKISHLKNSKSKTQNELKRLQNKFIKQNKNESKRKLMIEQLQQENEKLKDKYKIIRIQNKIITNNNLINSNEQSDILQNETNETIKTLQEEVEAQIDENNKLNDQINELKSKHIQEISMEKQKHFINENKYKQEINELKETIENYENVITKLRKKTKNTKVSLTKQYKESINDMEKQQNESKQSYESSIKTIKEKALESRELVKKLTNLLNESKETNERIKIENEELNTKIKTLEMNNKIMSEQINKEKQIIKNQLSAQQIICQSKIQDVIRKLKNEFNEEKENLLKIVSKPLSGLYKIDINNFDEEALNCLVDKIRNDIEKLRMLQNASI